MADVTKENILNCVTELYAELSHSVSITRICNFMGYGLEDRRIYNILNELVEEKRLVKSDSGFTPIGEIVTE